MEPWGTPLVYVYGSVYDYTLKDDERAEHVYLEVKKVILSF